MRIVLLFFALLIGSNLGAKPKVFFNYKIYYTPDHAAYVTTYLQFSGGTFKYAPTQSGALQASVEITQIFRVNDSIALVDKYLLDSPEMIDSIVDDFFDIQHYGLDPGVYNYELIVKDVLSGEQISGQQSLKIDVINDMKIQFSDIEFIQSAVQTQEKNNFVKNGYFILPYMTNYFPPEMEKIAFYMEIYNTAKVVGAEEKFLLTYCIANADNNQIVEGIFQVKRLPTSKIVPVIGYLPIIDLPSGDYNLMFNLIDKNNDTLASEMTLFQRRSDKEENYLSLEDITIDEQWMKDVPYDSIPYFLGSIMPISPRYEYETIRGMLQQGDTLMMERYFFAFWKKTNPTDPAREWYNYRQQVYYTEGLFGTQIKSGWETDRGRIWLKYGAPDQFIDRPNEPSAYPYQIWHYYRIGKRSDIRFIFYNPDLVTNDYPLLHSDMQGELQNYRWPYLLEKRDTPPSSVDDPGGSAHYGGNASLYYNEINR